MSDLARQLLWSSDDCAAWWQALTAYPAVVAARGERLPALDAWYRQELPALIAGRTPPHLTLDELVRVADWKMKRGVFRARNLFLVRGNDPAEVARASSEALARRHDLRAAVSRLAELAGVGPATASAVLAAAAPQTFPFFDEAVAAAAGLDQIEFTLPFYARYAATLQARAHALRGCPEVSWSAELVGRALWAASAVSAA